MRKVIRFISLLTLWSAATAAVWADSTWEYSVQLSASVQRAPAQITLSWPQDSWAQPSSYTVYRKSPGACGWGPGTTLPGTTTTFVDHQVAVGTAYEYQVVKATAHYSGFGYIYAGIEVPCRENRGKLLLVIDNTYAVGLQNELSELQMDLVGDGWTVLRLEVNRSDSVTKVKDLIKAEYERDPVNVKAVFLFGHVPVPYSGDIVPDGHAPDHQGAWPCDGFYGDMDGIWTDTVVNDTSGADPRTRNVPGDGKYDQSTFPAPLKLMVGRVDLANMPGRLAWGGPATFPSELELLRNYLNKDHRFRHKTFDLPRRAILGDYFGLRNGEAFAASGWRNLASFFGPSQLINLPEQGSWIPDLSTNPCLCAYACGAGSYTSISGLGDNGLYHDGVTTQLVSNDVKAAFFLLFGSWLGDWDSEDNLLRSVLALPSYGLASAWSGRPHWFLQHMALGEPIGFGARLTQNNGPDGPYQTQVNSAAGQIHIALMGDPTLRLHSVSPPMQVRGSTNGSGLDLHWTASDDAVLGYHVYSAATANGPFTRLTDTLIPGTQFTTPAPVSPVYMVRAVKLESSASGTYFNPSQGAFFTPGTSGIDYGVFASSLGRGHSAAAAKLSAPPVRSTTPASATVTPVGTTNAAVSAGTSLLIARVGARAAGRLTPTGLTLSNSVVWVDDALPPAP